MAPTSKKNANLISKSSDDASSIVKAPKKRATPRTPKTKPTPRPVNIIKVKINKPKDTVIGDDDIGITANVIGESVVSGKPIKYERHLQTIHRIQLSNEVAQSQLAKPEKDKPKKIGKEMPKPASKKAKPKKLEPVEDIAGILLPPPAKTKKVTKPKAPKAPPKPRVRKPKPPADETKIPSKPKKKCKPKTKSKKTATIDKIESQLNELSPDMLSELRSFKLSKTSSLTPSRNSSVSVLSATDNFEWTKEISSSNNSSPTKELVCLNGKLPEIKLIDCKRFPRRKRAIRALDTQSNTSSCPSVKRQRKVCNNTFTSPKKFKLSLKKRKLFTAELTEKANSEEKSESIDSVSVSYHSQSLLEPPKVVLHDVNEHEISSSATTVSNSLNLSSSSTSSSDESSNSDTDSRQTNTTNTDRPFQVIRQKLNSIDFEFITWLGSDVKELKINKFQNIFQNEYDAIKGCQDCRLKLARISKSSSEKSADRSVLQTSQDNSIKNDNVTATLEKVVDTLLNDFEISENNLKIEHNQEDSKENHFVDETIDNNNLEPNNVRHKSVEANDLNDDDDMLSLFAESLTGMESSKSSLVCYDKTVKRPETNLGSPEIKRSTNTNVTSSNLDVRSPNDNKTSPNSNVANDSYSNISFGSFESCPIILTKDKPQLVQSSTVNSSQNNDKAFLKPICEKQNADSTSANKDDRNNKNITPVNEYRQHREPQNNLISSVYHSVKPTKSHVLKGVCFYNLISNCKRNQCYFPHQFITLAEITQRLKSLTELQFIHEYMLLRKYPPLRTKYVILYAKECQRRDLTLLLLEMVIDTFREHLIKTHVIELSLFNLSNKNLSDYEFHLNFNLPYFAGLKLSDLLLKAIADTQNFTRFKQVFVKLTDFIIANKRSIELDVANQILERINILPHEELLAYAMVKVIKNTSKEIFENPAVKTFEAKLLKEDSGVHKFLVEYKKSVGVDLEGPLPVSVAPEKEKISENVQLNIQNTESNPYSLPNTATKCDDEIKKKKFSNLPLITRTIDTSNRTTTFIQKPPKVQNTFTPRSPPLQAALQRPRRPLIRPLIMPPVNRNNNGYVNNIRVNRGSLKRNVTPKFSLLSKRFSRD